MGFEFDKIFDTAKQNELLAVVLKISNKSKSLADYCDEIRDSALSRDAETKRNALNELAFIAINLPNDALSTQEVTFLLEFFTARFSDSGHTADLLVSVVHHLIFLRDLQNEVDFDALFHKIFDEAGVQAYIQADREMLLEIFEFIVKKHFYVVEKAGAAQFYTVFANAAGGERDPRCLIRVFSIFVYVLERMDFGALMEDIYELVACYWPIEYQPKVTDVNPLSREALSAACDACLLANRGFSLYTYQIISEKFLDDDESATHEKKLEACKLLANACQKFGTDSLEPFLNDFLAGFRMLSLNPKNHGIDSETMTVIGNTLKVLFETIEANDQNAEKTFKEMANTMLENCEPFVIQPEMGMSAKALCLLEKMLANQIVSNTILPRVFYWIYVLITGTTLKNQANKHEIVEETLALTPKWFSLAQKIEHVDTSQTNLLLSTVRKLEDFPKEQRLKMLSECGATLLKFDVVLSDECYSNIDETVKFIVDQFDDYDSTLKLPVFDFVSLYSTKRPENCSELTSTQKCTQKWSKMQFLLSAAVALSPGKLSSNLKLYLERLTDADNLFDALNVLLLLFDRLKSQEQELQFYLESVSEFLFSCIDKKLENEKLKLFGRFLQDLGLQMNKTSHEKLTEKCVQKLLQSSKGENYEATIIVLAPFCLQDQRPETHKQIVKDLDAVLSQNSQLFPYLLAFYFAYCNRSGKNQQSDVEVSSAKLEAKIAKCRSMMLTSNKLPSAELEEVFKNASSSSALEQLLNFNTELTDPEKCRYSKTLMWAQRIVTQFIPFFVDNYKNSVDSSGQHKQFMASLIIPILRLAKRVTISMVSELELLFPIIIESLHESNNDQEQTLLLLNATTQLLQLSTNESLSRDKLGQIAYASEKLLLSPNSSNKIIFATLEVLELLAKRTSSKTQILRLEPTLCAIRSAVQSKKRVIRQKGAFVRGLWEMISK